MCRICDLERTHDPSEYGWHDTGGRARTRPVCDVLPVGASSGPPAVMRDLVHIMDMEDLYMAMVMRPNCLLINHDHMRISDF